MVYIADLSILKLFQAILHLKFIQLKNWKVWSDENKSLAMVATYWWWKNHLLIISIDSKKQIFHSVTLELIWTIT